MAEKFDEFMEDVEKDIRQEKMEKIWNQYGKLISAGLIGAVTASGAFVMWKNHSQNQLNLTSQKFMMAQNLTDKGSFSEATGVYDSISKESSKTYAALAQISKAALLLKKGSDESKKAIETLTTLSKNKSAHIIMREFAMLTLVRVETDSIDMEKIDDAAKAKLISQIVILDAISQDKSPWRLQALELKGSILFALKDYMKASDVFVKLAQEKECPEGLRARAEIMSQLILKQIASTAA